MVILSMCDDKKQKTENPIEFGSFCFFCTLWLKHIKSIIVQLIGDLEHFKINNCNYGISKSN